MAFPRALLAAVLLIAVLAACGLPSVAVVEEDDEVVPSWAAAQEGDDDEAATAATEHGDDSLSTTTSTTTTPEDATAPPPERLNTHPPAARGPAPSMATAAVQQACLAGGASLTERDLGGVLTVWGHNDSSRGAERVGADVLASRLDLWRGIRAHVPSAGCRRALDAAVDAREKLQLWALKMHASSVALPDALLSGKPYHMGDFDECLSVANTAYCLLDVEVRPATCTPPSAHAGDEHSPFHPPHGADATLWDLLKTSGNRRRYRRDLQHWALCVPRECGGAGLGRAVAAAVDGLGRSLAVELLVRLEPADCHDPAAEDPADTGFLEALRRRPYFLAGSIAILAFPSLTLLATAKTVWLLYVCGQRSAPDKQGVLSQMLDCFSAQANWRKLGRRQNSQIHAVQGLRVVTIVFIIFGHRAMYMFGGPLLNMEYVEDSFTRAAKMLVINGNVVVSTFFVISGFLEARLSMRHIGVMRRFDLLVVLQHYLIRYLRLLPALAVVLAVEVLWVDMLGSGPMWNQLVSANVRDCRAHWWANLLFINNYLSPSSRCLLQTWFLAAVLQLYLVTPLLMWLVSRWTLRALWPGCLLLGLLLAGAAAALVATTVRLGLHPVLHIYPQKLYRGNIAHDPTFRYQYVATHTNAVPYVVGLIMGTLFYLADRRQWRPSQAASLLLWLGILLGSVLQLAAIMSGVVFLQPWFRPRPLLDALYGPARQLAFSVPSAWIIFVCGIGAGGVVETILTWTPLLSLGRLTYSVYLVHLTLISVSAGYVRQPESVSNFVVLHHTVADVAFSFGLGLLLHLCVEAPMGNLQAMAFGYWFDKSGQPADRRAARGAAAATPPPEDGDDAHDDDPVAEAAGRRSRRSSSLPSSANSKL